MLKLLIFWLWARRIGVPFDRSILNVQKTGLFVNCVSAKPPQTPFFFLLKIRSVYNCNCRHTDWIPFGNGEWECPYAHPTMGPCVALHFVPLGTLLSSQGCKDLWFVIVSNFF